MSTFNEDQKLGILIKHYKTAQDAKIAHRAHALILHLKSKTPVEIADLLIVSDRTVARWIKSYKEDGIGSIFPGYYNNQNAAKLTREQKQEVKEYLEINPLPIEYWKAPDLKGYLSARFDVEYKSKESYCALLRFCNYSYKLPDLFNIRRNESYVKKRMKEIHKEIKPLLTDPNWVVMASDESRIEWKTIKRRAWMKKGEKTVVKEKKGKEYQNYIGFLDIQTGRDYLYRLEWQNQETVIEALRKLLKEIPDKKICIVWDNAGFHRGKEIRKLLGEGNEFGRIKLMHLPPYAPDKNPQEYVWKYAKEFVANGVYNKFDELRFDFERAIEDRTFDYNL